MKINHKIINKSALARAIDMNEFVFNGKLKHGTFTLEELEKIKEVFEDLFCYLFECDEIKCVRL